jgi:cytochrome c553
MHFRLTWALGVGLALNLALAITAAHAEDAQGDAARGKPLAYTCHGCHGIANYKNAAPTYSVPKLGGQQAAYMIAALKEYASGERVHPTMHAHAASNSEQDRADMATFFQGQNNKPNTQVVGTPPASVQVCTACHGANGFGISADYPTLAGQQEDYLEQALRDYKSGKRKNAVMGGLVSAVKEQDIPAIAAFFAKQKGLCSTDQIRDNDGTCK